MEYKIDQLHTPLPLLIHKFYPDQFNEYNYFYLSVFRVHVSAVIQQYGGSQNIVEDVRTDAVISERLYLVLED